MFNSFIGVLNNYSCIDFTFKEKNIFIETILFIFISNVNPEINCRLVTLVLFGSFLNKELKSTSITFQVKNIFCENISLPNLHLNLLYNGFIYQNSKSISKFHLS